MALLPTWLGAPNSNSSLSYAFVVNGDEWWSFCAFHDIGGSRNNQANWQAMLRNRHFLFLGATRTMSRDAFLSDKSNLRQVSRVSRLICLPRKWFSNIPTTRFTAIVVITEILAIGFWSPSTELHWQMWLWKWPNETASADAEPPLDYRGLKYGGGFEGLWYAGTVWSCTTLKHAY